MHAHATWWLLGEAVKTHFQAWQSSLDFTYKSFCTLGFLYLYIFYYSFHLDSIVVVIYKITLVRHDRTAVIWWYGVLYTYLDRLAFVSVLSHPWFLAFFIGELIFCLIYIRRRGERRWDRIWLAGRFNSTLFRWIYLLPCLNLNKCVNMITNFD